jgi:hypothetical protein
MIALRDRPRLVGAGSHRMAQLGGDHHVVAVGEVLQRASEDLLTHPKRINVGGIEEIDPQLKGVLDDRAAVFLVQHPLVNPACRVSEPHAAEADARHVHAGGSELGVLHITFLLSITCVQSPMRLTFNDWQDQARGMCSIMHNTIDRRLVLVGCFMHDITARVAVAGKPWEVTARHLQPDAVA